MYLVREHTYIKTFGLPDLKLLINVKGYWKGEAFKESHNNIIYHSDDSLVPLNALAMYNVIIYTYIAPISVYFRILGEGMQMHSVLAEQEVYNFILTGGASPNS